MSGCVGDLNSYDRICNPIRQYIVAESGLLIYAPYRAWSVGRPLSVAIMAGWIKLHRKLTESLIFGNEKGLKVWVWCLLKANHSERQVLIGRTKVTVKKGQFIMGSKTAKEELNLAKATLWYWLNFLEEEGQVRLSRTAKYTVVTIPKWEEYQSNLDADETLSRTQKRRSVGTNKNEENVKEVVVETKAVPEEGEDSRPTKMPKDEQALSLVHWAEKRRGFKFTSVPAQLGAIGRAKRAGISPSRLKARWEELENETWRNGFDWVDVVKSFDKRA